AHAAVLHFIVDQVGIGRIDGAAVAIAAEDRQPVFVDWPDVAVQSDARPAPGAVVLQAAVDPVGPLGADGDVVELAEGHGVEMVPVIGAVVADVMAAVGADEHVPAILGADPHGVTVGVDAFAGVPFKRLAAVGGAVLGNAEDIDVLGIARI